MSRDPDTMTTRGPKMIAVGYWPLATAKPPAGDMLVNRPRNAMTLLREMCWPMACKYVNL